MLEAVIGQVDEPFKVTLVYASCQGKPEAAVALDSLELINCEPGGLSAFQMLHTVLFARAPRGAMLAVE